VLTPEICRGDGALIAALVRQTREQLGLDLGACRRWRRLVEVHYARPAAGIPAELQRVRVTKAQDLTSGNSPRRKVHCTWAVAPATNQLHRVLFHNVHGCSTS
jgi:DBC1